MQVDIWVPAHNEEATIKATLQSIRAATAACKDPDFHFQVGVIANACTDGTIAEAEDIGAQILNVPEAGKWRALSAAIEKSSADWLIFVDAGTLWSSQLLQKDILEWMCDPAVMGWTLEYSTAGGSILAQAYWWLESRVKELEVYAGGLVAVSGFTMAFRRRELKDVLELLQRKWPMQQWWNDDVVLPLTMRILHPQKKILLHSLAAQPAGTKDVGFDKKSVESRRRLRMMRGNLQWIRTLYPMAWKKEGNWVVALIATRRLLKVFWAPLLVLIFIPVVPDLAISFALIACAWGQIDRHAPGAIAAFSASWQGLFEIFFRREKDTPWS